MSVIIDISLRIVTFIPKLLNNSLASCSLINLNILLPHTAKYDKSIDFSFFFL